MRAGSVGESDAWSDRCGKSYAVRGLEDARNGPCRVKIRERVDMESHLKIICARWRRNRARAVDLLESIRPTRLGQALLPFRVEESACCDVAADVAKSVYIIVDGGRHENFSSNSVPGEEVGRLVNRGGHGLERRCQLEQVVGSENTSFLSESHFKFIGRFWSIKFYKAPFRDCPYLDHRSIAEAMRFEASRHAFVGAYPSALGAWNSDDPVGA